MVWSEESQKYSARCATAVITSGCTTRLQIVVTARTGDILPRKDVSALLVPVAHAIGGDLGALPEGTLTASSVDVVDPDEWSRREYEAEFALPAGVEGEYQLLVDWRHGPARGDFVAVDTDDVDGVVRITAGA